MSVALPLIVWVQLALGQPQWLALHPGGQVTEGWGLRSLASEASQAPAPSIWLWSWQHAPVALATGSAPPERALKGDGPFWLEIRGVRPLRGPSLPARIIAAPVEMWRAIPESKLPSWPVPAGGHLSVPVDGIHAWRLRWVAEGQGSWWAEIPPGRRSVVLRAIDARGIALTVVGPDGKAAEKVHVSVSEATVRQGGSRTWALLTDAAGRITAPGLPDDQEVALNLFQAGSPPLMIRGWPSTFPRQVTLSPGAEIRGRITDSARHAISNATVEVEAWIGRSPQLVRLADKTRADGSFALRGLPPGRLNLTLRASGYVPRVEPLILTAGERRELGTRALEPGARLRVEVVDEVGHPVPGAAVEAGPGLSAIADSVGQAELLGIPLAPLELRGTAPRHQPGSQRLQTPFPALARLELHRVFTVRGRLLDGSGSPVFAGTLVIEAANCTSEGALTADGRFEEDFQTGQKAQLILRSPATRELRLPLAPGTAGEVRDLGDLTAPIGPEVTGTVGNREGGPLAGARVWLPRPGPQGAAMAWASHDLVEATSGEDGRFHLSGLAAGPATLRVEAAGYARATLDVIVPEGADGTAGLDVGIITLSGGAIVHVHVDAAGLGRDSLGDAVARIDLRRQWLDADLLSAQVWDGEAEVPDVPPGAARVSVAMGPKVLCEKDIDVSGGGELDVDCAPGSLLVSGRVLVGGSVPGSGTLVWHSSEAQGWSRIDNQVSPTGLRQQQTFNGGRPQVDAVVEGDGTFQTRDLTPGPWRVSFQPQQGSSSSELALDIPPGDHFEAVLPFAGLNVAGVVVTKDGNPAGGAIVTELTGGAFAIARTDGSFMLTGLAPGKLAIQARQDELASAVATVELAAAGMPPPLRLVVQAAAPPQVTVTVLSVAGAPLPGAMVFFEEEGKGMRLLVAASDGSAAAGIEAPLAPRVRAGAFAAGGFALGDWTDLETARQGLVLHLGDAGGLLLRTKKGEGAARVLSSNGWDLSWMMRLLGGSTEVAPSRPLHLDGLPAGDYTVTLGAATAKVSVAPGAIGEGTIE